MSNSLLFSVFCIFTLTQALVGILVPLKTCFLLRCKMPRRKGRKQSSGRSRPITICLVVECHELYPMEPEHEGVGVGRVNASGSWVRPQQLAGGVLDQFLRIPAT